MKDRNRYRPMIWLAVIVTVVVLSGCSSTGGQSAPPNPVTQQSGQPSSAPGSSPRPMFYDFPDIPVPTELEISQNESYVFQSGSFKAGLMTFKGRVDINSVINFFQMAMPREGWKAKGGFRYRRSVLVYEKQDKTCVINLYTKLYYTYVEVYVAPMSSQF